MSKSIFLTTLIAIFISLFSTACSDNDSSATIDFGTPPSSELITSGSVDVITENEVRYHVIVIAGNFTSTIVESETGLTIVDLGPSFIPGSGADIRTYATAINKAMAIIITHDHADHYGNIAEFTDVDVYAQSDVAGALSKDTGFTDVYTNAVNSVSNSQTINGFDYQFDKISNAETGENGYLSIASVRALFVGDLGFSAAHAFIREYTPLDATDEIDNWIKGLNSLKSDFSEFDNLFLGHNGSRTDISGVINEDIAYLSDAQGLIKGGKPLTTGGIATTVIQVTDELNLLYPEFADGALLLSLPDAFFPGDPGANWF